MVSIVVGYRASNEGEAAVSAAIDEARLRSDRLEVVIAQHHESEGPREAEVLADGLRERLEATGLGFAVRLSKRSDDFAQSLLDASRETAASLIVIGLRRRTPMGRLFLGRNAQRILLDSPVPVLCVKA